MSKKNVTLARMSARFSRLERKYERLLTDVRYLRESLTPRRSELDEVIASLRRSADAMREQSRIERRYLGRISEL